MIKIGTTKILYYFGIVAMLATEACYDAKRGSIADVPDLPCVFVFLKADASLKEVSIDSSRTREILARTIHLDNAYLLDSKAKKIGGIRIYREFDEVTYGVCVLPVPLISVRHGKDYTYYKMKDRDLEMLLGMVHQGLGLPPPKKGDPWVPGL